MLSTLRWAGSAANANNLADPNASFDPTLSCVSGEDAARDALVLADVSGVSGVGDIGDLSIGVSAVLLLLG